MAACLREIVRVVDECAAAVRDTVCGALIGVAGIGTGSYQRDFGEMLARHYRFPVRVVSDAELLLSATLGRQPGIIVIAGTGSVAWWYRPFAPV